MSANTLLPIVSGEPRNATFNSSVQFANALVPILFTLAGIITSLNFVHPANAAYSIFCTFVPIVTFSKFVNPLKERSLIFPTVFFISISSIKSLSSPISESHGYIYIVVPFSLTLVHPSSILQPP